MYVLLYLKSGYVDIKICVTNNEHMKYIADKTIEFDSCDI